jgi:hypothetical protein
MRSDSYVLNIEKASVDPSAREKVPVFTEELT